MRAESDRYLHIATHDDRWVTPLGRYAVHRTGMAVEYFYKLEEAKAFVVDNHGPQKWERREVPDGRGTRREWWPKAEDESV